MQNWVRHITCWCHFKGFYCCQLTFNTTSSLPVIYHLVGLAFFFVFSSDSLTLSQVSCMKEVSVKLFEQGNRLILMSLFLTDQCLLTHGELHVFNILVLCITDFWLSTLHLQFKLSFNCGVQKNKMGMWWKCAISFFNVALFIKHNLLIQPCYLHLKL